MNKKIYFIFLIFLFSLYFIEFIYALPNDADNIINFNYQKSINYSLIPTVNNSNTLQGYNSSDFWKSYEEQIGLTGNKIGSFNFVTSGEATAGKLNVDNLYVDGDNITSITGTIKFGDENLVTTSGVRCNSITTNYFKENSGLLGLSFSLGSMSLSPDFDNFLNLGNSTNRFSQVYSLYYNGNGSKLTGVCLSNGTGCQTFSSMNYTNLVLTNKSNNFTTGSQYFQNIITNQLSVPMINFSGDGINGVQSVWNYGSDYLYSSDFNNFLYFADKRFNVSLTNFKSARATDLFDGEYESSSRNKILAGTTAVVNIKLAGNLTNKTFYGDTGTTYGGYGDFLLSFYGPSGTGLDNLTIIGRKKNKDGVWTNFTNVQQINSGTKRIMRIYGGSVNYVTEMEIYIKAGSFDTQYGLVEVEFISMRISGNDRLSGIEKYHTTDLYKMFSWYNDTGHALTNISQNGFSTTGNIQGQYKSLDGTSGVTRTLNLTNASTGLSCTAEFKNGLYTGGTC